MTTQSLFLLQFLLIDFGETVELYIEDIFKIVDDNEKNKIFSVPSLAFQCTIAKISPALNHLKFKNTWSIEANNVFKEHSQYLRKLIGTVSKKIIF